MNWGILGKLGAAAAAPFTGGLSLSAIPAIDAIGAGAGAAAQGMAANRGAKTSLEMDKVAAGQQGQRDMLSALMQRDQAQQSAQPGALRQMMALNYLGDPSRQVQSPGLSTYSKPLAGTPDATRDLAHDPALLSALRERMTFQHDPLGGFMPSMPNFSGADKAAKTGILEKILGIGGAAASAYGAAKAPKPPIMSAK